MANRIGGLEEFEFKPIGDNHNQGVSPFVHFIIDYFLFTVVCCIRLIQKSKAVS